MSLLGFLAVVVVCLTALCLASLRVAKPFLKPPPSLPAEEQRATNALLSERVSHALREVSALSQTMSKRARPVLPQPPDKYVDEPVDPAAEEKRWAEAWKEHAEAAREWETEAAAGNDALAEEIAAKYRQKAEHARRKANELAAQRERSPTVGFDLNLRGPEQRRADARAWRRQLQESERLEQSERSDP